MRRKKLFSTAILLIVILSKYEAEAAGFNGHKGSDNPKDLQIIHDKFTIGREQTIEIVKKLTTTMKQEQKGFETELDAFLKATPNAPASMKKMLSDQKGMQAEVDKLATDVQKYKGHFEKWLGDVKNLKTKDNMTIYEEMKPFIRELDPMTDKFKTYTQKFIDQAKRYREFGQSMLDSGFVDTTVNKRLCGLGKVIEETGFHVSDVGDPIAIAADKIGDIWQRTNPRDKDNSLVQISKKLVPKAQELVSNGDTQATDGKKLIEMCKKIEVQKPPETNPKPPDTTPKPHDTTPKPHDTTPKPHDTTPKPPDTTPKPPDTTPKPPDTTPKPPDTTPKPPDTTHKPPDTTPKPPDTTPKPPDTTPKPPDTTPKPPDTTTEPHDTTTEPHDTTPNPPDTTPKPPTTTAQPPDTTPKPAGPNENAKDLEGIEQDLADIAHELDNLAKDIEIIKKEQDGVENDAGNDYPNNDKVSKQLDKLHKDCEALANEAKTIGKDVQKLRKSESNDIGNPFKEISGRILELAKKVLALAKALEDLERKILKNYEALKDSNKLTPEICKRIIIQGKKFHDCGTKLNNIAHKLGTETSEGGITAKMFNIGQRLETEQGMENGQAVKDIAKQLKGLGHSIAEIAKALMNNSELLQKCQGSSKPVTTTPKEDNWIQKDLDAIANLLREWAADLERLKIKLGEIEKKEMEIEGKLGEDLKDKGLGKELGDLKAEIDHIKAEVLALAEAVKKQKAEDEKGMLTLAEKNVGLCKNLLELSKKLDILANKCLDNGLGLRENEKFTVDAKPIFDKVGKLVEEAGIILIGMSNKLDAIANKVGKDDAPTLKDYAVQLKYLGDKVNEKGSSVEVLGFKIQKLEPNVKDPALDKELEDMQETLGQIYDDLEAIIKDLEGIQNEQKAIEAEAGKYYTEPNVISNEIDDLLKDCKNIVDGTKSIEKDIQNAREGPNKDVAKVMRPIAEKILNLDKRILTLAQKLEKLGQKIFKNGEDLREKEKFTTEIKPKFDKQGQLLENIGRKLHSIGRHFIVFADKIESIGNRKCNNEGPSRRGNQSLGRTLTNQGDGDDGCRLQDFARQVKDLGEKVKGKGASVEEIGIKIQKLEPNVRDTAIDKDLEDLQNALDEIARDLESILKALNTIKKEQTGVEAEAGNHYKDPNVLPKKLEELYNDCKKLADDAKASGKELQKVRAGPSKNIGKAVLPVAEKILQLDTRILALAEKLELLAQAMLKNAEDLREKEQLTPEIKAKFDKQGKKLQSIGQKFKNIGKNFHVIGDRMVSIGNRLSGAESSKLNEYATNLKSFGDKINEKGGSIEELGIALQKLEPNVRDTMTDKELEDMQKLLNDIALILEDIIKDLQAIKATQAHVETHAEQDYPEPDTIPKFIDELIENCKKLAVSCKAAGKELDNVSAVQSKEVGETLPPIGETIGHLAERLLNLTERLEQLGGKILKNAEHLQKEQRFSPELKTKMDRQGQKLENIGNKLKNIAKSFCLIGDRITSIGSRIKTDDGAQLNELGTQIKNCCAKIKTKGESVKELGIQLQRLEPKEFNNYKENADDIAEIQKAVVTILDYLKETQADILDLKSLQEKLETETANNCSDKGTIPKKLQNVALSCADLINTTKDIAKDLENIRNNPPKDVGKPVEDIGNKLYDLARGILKLTENLEVIGKNLLTCGEYLYIKCLLTPALKERFNIMGLKLECLDGKLEIIGDQFKILGEKFQSIGKRIGQEQGARLVTLGESFVQFSIETKEKGRLVSQVGAKLQSLKANEGDSKDHKANKEDLLVIHRDLTEAANEIENLIIYLDLFKKDQKRIEADKELEIPQKDLIPKELDSIRDECFNLANETRALIKDLDKVLCGPACLIGKPLAEIGDKIVPLDMKILALGDRLGELGESLLSIGQTLVAEDKFVSEVQRKFRNQGKKCESSGDKIGRVGEKFENIGARISRIAARPGAGNNLEVEDSGLEIKNLGGRIEEKGGQVEEVCLQIQKLEPNQTDSEVDKCNKRDMMMMGRRFENIEHDLEDIVKYLGNLNSEQKSVEGDLQMRYPAKGAVPKEVDLMAKECRKLGEVAGNLKKEIEKTKDEPLNRIAEPLLGVADRLGELGNKVMPLAGKLEELGETLLKNGETLQTAKNLSPRNKAKLDSQGKDLKNIGNKLLDIGEKTGDNGKLLDAIGERISEPKLKEVGQQLDSLGERIKGKGDSDKESGIELQKLQPSLPDEQAIEKEKKKDMDIVLKGLGDVGKFLAQMGEKLKPRDDDPVDMEGCEGQQPVKKREILDQYERLQEQTDKVQRQAESLAKELNRIETSSPKNRERQLAELGNKVVSLANNTLELAGNLEHVGGNMKNNAEGLRDDGKCECMNKYRKQGQRWEEIGIILEGIAGKVRIFGDTGKRLWVGNLTKMANIPETLKKVAGRIRSKGSEVNVCGKKIINLGHCTPKFVPDPCAEDLKKEWQKLHKEFIRLLEQAVALGDMERNLGVGDGTVNEDLQSLTEWLDEAEREGHNLEKEIKGICDQKRDNSCEKIAEKILDLCERFRHLTEILEKMGKRILKKGQQLVKGKFDRIGRKVEDLGEKLERLGNALKEIGRKLGDYSGQRKSKEQSEKLGDLGKRLKCCGDKVNDNGGVLKNLGAEIQKLPVSRNPPKEDCGCDLSPTLDKISKILNRMLKLVKDLGQDEYQIGGEVSGKVDILEKEREGLVDELVKIIEEVEKVNGKNSKDVGKEVVLIGKIIVALAEQGLRFAVKVENTGLKAVKNGDSLKDEGKMRVGLKDEYRLEGERYAGIGDYIKQFGKSFTELGKVLGELSVQLGICFKDDCWSGDLEGLAKQVEQSRIKEKGVNIRVVGVMMQGMGGQENGDGLMEGRKKNQGLGKKAGKAFWKRKADSEDKYKSVEIEDLDIQMSNKKSLSPVNIRNATADIVIKPDQLKTLINGHTYGEHFYFSGGRK